VDADRLIDSTIGAAPGSEEERKQLAERLKRKERVREKKRGERKKKKEKEKKANEEQRKREEEEEDGVVTQLHSKAEEAKEEDQEFEVKLGMRKVTIMRSLLRNEPKSSLYRQATNNESARELVCLMDETTWSLIFKWLNT